MKRQNAQVQVLSSSSSYREATPNAGHQQPDNKNHLHANACATSSNIGCMSALFRIISRSHQPRRKSITLGKKQEKNVIASSRAKDKSSSSGTAGQLSPPLTGGSRQNDAAAQKISCHVPRSPTLPPEIRHSNSPGNFRSASTPPPTTVVARLMGLSDPAASASPSRRESPAKKRRELLGALEKCDQDLRALKKIIDVVRSAEGHNPRPDGAARIEARRESAASGAAAEEETVRNNGDLRQSSNNNDNSDDSIHDGDDQQLREEQQNQQQEQQPSPVSVLDEFTRSTLISGYIRTPHANNTAARPVQPQQKKRPGEEDSYNLCLFDRIANESSLSQAKAENWACPLWMSKAMRQSVEQVCKDVDWGLRREVGRIGLALHDHICRDLIEETVAEMGFYCCMSSLPFEACKRRLRF